MKSPATTPALAFVDIETTGSNFEHDQITEIAVATLDSQGVDYWETLINPQTHIPIFIQNLTGITPEMVITQPLFEDIASQLFEILSDKIFVAHNARFDLGFIKTAFAKIGLNFKPKVLCTVKLSRHLFPHERKHNLDALLTRHNLQNSARHRAMGDAKSILQFWQHCAQHFGEERLLAAASQVMGRPSLPTHIDPALIEAMPDTPGVYIFYAENDECLYIGKSKNIKTRVLSHFQEALNKRKEAKLSLQIRHIEWIETGGELGALLLESKLIKERLPLTNILLRKSSNLYAWQLDDTQSGYLGATLISNKELKPGLQDNIYGLFKSKKDATEFLKSLAERHMLCEAVLGLEKVRPGQSCFAYQLKKCSGHCIGVGNKDIFNLQLRTALEALRVSKWPYPGAIAVVEEQDCHVFLNWCYLGQSNSQEQAEELVYSADPQFDHDIYKILKSYLSSTKSKKIFQLNMANWQEKTQ
jgi:DNA polymerase-3 subunit epsilon